MKRSHSILLASCVLASVLFAQSEADACSGGPAVGCPLPEHEAPKLPSDVSVLAGNDQVSVTPFGGNLVVRATDVSLPSVGGFGLHVTRTYHSNRLLLGAPGTLDPDFQRHEGPLGLGWTFHYGVVWFGLNAQTQSLAYELVTGAGTSEVFYLNDSALSSFAAVGGSSQTYVSKGLNVLYVDGSNQDRLYVHQTSGLRYTYDRLVSIMQPNATCAGIITIQGLSQNACQRFVPTKIEDISGNTWTISYDLAVQEYMEHPIITSIATDDGRQLTFSYATPSAGAPEPLNPRALTNIKLDGSIVASYGHATAFGRWHLLTSASTPSGRTTTFTHDQSGSGAPNLLRFGLLVGIENPLGGGTGIVYSQRSFRSPSFFPRQASVQAVDKLVYDTNGVVVQNGDLEDAYAYSDGAADFRVTISHKVGSTTQATRTIHHHAYPLSGCGDLDLVGLSNETSLAANGDTLTESTTYGSPLEISQRAVNFYCPNTRPRTYRVTSASMTDGSLASSGLTITTTPSSYDFLSPQTVQQSNGLTTLSTYQNVVGAGRFVLGLPKSMEKQLGGQTLEETTNIFYSGAASHLVRDHIMARNASATDTFTFTYYSSTGIRGALKDMTRSGLTTTYHYTHGTVRQVELPGATEINRSGVTKYGTFASETRHGVTTAFGWDGDWRLTQLVTGGMEPVNITYCSASQPSCTSNYYCIARGATCSGGLQDDDGKRIVTFDGLGRRTSQEDWIAGSTKATKSWTAFDFRHLPTSYTDPVRGAMTLSYDVGGRLLSETLPGGTVLTSIARQYTASARSETTTKRGITLYDTDDWAGRPLQRGFRRAGHNRIDLNYAWSPTSAGWQSSITSSAWSGGFSVQEVHDFVGHLVSETRPEIGNVVHVYDGRGFKTESRFSGLGYSLCNTVNAQGQITETRKQSGGGACSPSSGQVITSATYHAATTRLTSMTRQGGHFDPSATVTRVYSNPDSAGRSKGLTLQIPRSLDAPAPWQGAELFPRAPDAVGTFRNTKLAFTTVEEVGTTGRYEVEMRALAGAASLMPTYDWGEAQKECEEGDVLTRGPWTAGNIFNGSDLEAFVANANPSWQFDVLPDTLYCWRVRAVRCHDGMTCQRPEISPAGLWGVFAFNNPAATPIGRDGWDTIPTNYDLNVEDAYLPCVGLGCPNVAKRGEASVELSVNRVWNVAGHATSIAYPSADSSLEAWATGGSVVSIGRNYLGDPERLTLTLPGGHSHVLAHYTSFDEAGQPLAGVVNTLGYDGNSPGAFNLVSLVEGEIGQATVAQPTIGLSWQYDGDGRLTSHVVSRNNETLYGINNIQYTADSLISSWNRSDLGLMTSSYSAGHDERGQLTSYTVSAGANGGGTVTYGYDQNGNLTSRGGQISVGNLGHYEYSNGREYSSPTGVVSLGPISFGSFGANNRSVDPAIGYDTEARIVADHGRQLTYAHDDRIETIRGPDGFVERQMLYDGEGNLVRLVEGHQAHYYLSDESGQLLYEEVHDRWFYGSHFRDSQGRVVPNSRRYEHLSMGDSHIATVEHAAGVTSFAYHLRDWRDFEVVSLDADDAFTRSYHEPSPYGLEMRVAAQNTAATATHRPAPYLLDLGVGGYHHNGWRTMDASSGRFLRPDPARARHLRIPQGVNLYANNLNNPLAYRDRDGDIAFLIPAAIIAYRVWSAYETANDVISVVEMVTNPETTTGDFVAAGAGALAGVVLGKVGGTAVKAGIKRFGNRVFQRAAKVARAGVPGACFPAGTMVSTETGLRPIEDVAEGDLVDCAEPEEGSDRLCEVESLIRYDYAGDLVTITTTAEVIEATGSHSFWVTFGEGLGGRPQVEEIRAEGLAYGGDGRWVAARDLRAGDELLALSSGKAVLVQQVSVRQAQLPVFNLTVEGLHTYQVGVSGVLVHNKAMPGPKVKQSPFGPKIADQVPNTGVPKGWSRERIRDVIADYETSLVSRRAELAAFDAAGGGSAIQRLAHARRISAEEGFLRSLYKVLEGLGGAPP